MTGMSVLFKNQSAALSRWVGLLLVVFILYGTTVEAAHRHGRILPANAGASAHVDTEQTKNLANSKTGCSDCLICQLHQNFSTTLIVIRLNHPPTQLPHKITAAVAPDILSQIISPLAGRGPPFIS
jgi:hypothetical protein